MSKLFYTGVGSRETPREILDLMTATAAKLEGLGYVLRSGGAPGADSAFEKGVASSDNKEIWVPWLGFNGSQSSNIPSAEAYSVTATVHPAWNILKETHRLLHSRNVHQVLGQDLNTPSNFLICWTDKAQVIGGTATAIRIAKRYNVPVINLGAWSGINDAIDGLECALASADPENLLTIKI